MADFIVVIFEDGTIQHYLKGIPIDDEEVTEAIRRYGQPECECD